MDAAVLELWSNCSPRVTVTARFGPSCDAGRLDSETGRGPIENFVLITEHGAECSLGPGCRAAAGIIRRRRPIEEPTEHTPQKNFTDT